MGWLTTIAGLGAIAAAPFTGGTSLGIGLPLLLGSAGAQIIGAGMASDASKNAAKTQAQAGKDAMAIDAAGRDRALAAINQNYGQAQNLYSPYRDMSAAALPGLAQLAGSAYRGSGSTIYAPPPMRSVGNGQTPAAAAANPYAAQGQPVMMRAPNGQTQQVPATMVQHYLQRGAQVVTQ